MRYAWQLDTFSADTDTVLVRDVFANLTTPAGDTWQWCQSGNRYYGDVGPVQPSDLAYYSQLRDAARDSDITPATADYVRFCGYSDYSGGLVDVSNTHALIAISGEYDATTDTDNGVGVIRITGDYGSSALCLPTDAPISVQLAGAITAMIDSYPVVDDSDYSAREWQLVTEYAASADYLSGVRDMTGIGEWVTDAELTGYIADAIRSDYAGEYPYVEGTDSVIMPDGVLRYVRDVAPWLWRVEGDTAYAGATIRGSLADVDAWVQTMAGRGASIAAPDIDTDADTYAWRVEHYRTVIVTRITPDDYVDVAGMANTRQVTA